MSKSVGSESSPRIKWKEMTTFSKFYEIFKWTGAIAALCLAGYSKCESERAKARADSSPPEVVTKAALDELSKKINDLAHDVETKEKAFLKTMNRLVRGFSKRATSAEAKSESVRSLFIGHALASRSTSRSSVKRDLENLTKSINDAAKQSKSAGSKPIQVNKTRKKFSPARKYKEIKAQQKKMGTF